MEERLEGMKKSITGEREDTALYDWDFYAWTQSAAEDLRQGQLSEEDAQHVAEEVADMGKRDRRELRSRMTVLIMHLMKWAAQPKLRNKSTWKATTPRASAFLSFKTFLTCIRGQPCGPPMRLD
jgi:hypothetical protein